MSDSHTHRPIGSWTELGGLMPVPLSMFLCGLWLPAAYGPAGALCGDPSYFFLFDALNLLNGHPLRYFNQPATPVTMLVALVSSAVGPSGGGAELIDDVIRGPGAYIGAAYLVLMLLYALALAALGYVVWQRSKRIDFAVAAQAAPFLLGNFNRLEPLTSECLLNTAVVLLLVFAVSDLDERKRSAWRAPAYGAVIGLSLATKLTSAPLAFIPLLLLGGLRQVLWFGMTAILCFALWTAPLWPQYSSFVEWVTRVAAHQGAYGSGEAGILPWSTWLINFAVLMLSNPFYTLWVIAAAVLTVRRYKDIMAGNRASLLMAGLVLAAIAQFALVAKQPSNHFLIPARATAGVLFWLVIERWPQAQQWATRRRLLAAGAVVAALALSALLGSMAPQAAVIQARLDSDYANWAKVFYAGASLAPYSLQRGSWEAGADYVEILSRTYPHTYFYHAAPCCVPEPGQTGLFDWSGKSVTLDQIKTGRDGVVFVGGGLITDKDGVFRLLADEDREWREAPVQLREVLRGEPFPYFLHRAVRWLDARLGAKLVERGQGSLITNDESIYEAIEE